MNDRVRTNSPTPTEKLALRTANAALLESLDPWCDIVATVVFALGSAQLLQSPETAAELERLRAEAEAAIQWIDEYTPQPATVPGAVVRVLAGLDRERRRLDAERTELWERVEKLRARVAELETQGSRVRTDELVPGDRVWHPYDSGCFTVSRAAAEGSAPKLRFHNRVTDAYESGMRVTGMDDSGETVHVDCAPSYLWHREDAASEVARLRARVAELEAERHTTNEALSNAAEQLRVNRDRIAELQAERATVVAERDAQIIAWLAKKAQEYGTSNRENRAKAEAVWRMADKLSRGAVRPPAPHPTAGELAEQRHLMDPLDHACEALAPRSEAV